jgi:hypothetical protein
MKRRTGALLLAALAWPLAARGQARASERSVFSQTVDGTTVTIDYARPRARGRDPLFGGVVEWGKTWTPGANQATTLEADEPVTVNGHALEAGTYSVWMVVRESGDWETILDPDAGLFHTQPPEPSDDQVRFAVTPEEGPFMEALTWYAPTYSSAGMTLHMHWGTTVVPIEVEVQPTQRTTVSADEATPIVGTYHIHWVPADGPHEGEPNEGAPRDEASSETRSGDSGADPGGGATNEDGTLVEPFDFVVTHREDGTLFVRTRAPGGGHWPDPLELLLIPRAEGVFVPAVVVGDEIGETLIGTLMEFLLDDGSAPSFEFRTAGDQLLARGARTGG